MVQLVTTSGPKDVGSFSSTGSGVYSPSPFDPGVLTQLWLHPVEYDTGTPPSLLELYEWDGAAGGGIVAGGTLLWSTSSITEQLITDDPTLLATIRTACNTADDPTGGLPGASQLWFRWTIATAPSFWTVLIDDVPPPGGLRVVSAAGDVYRVTPTLPNPDGGVLRLVQADGTVWIQGASTTGPGTQEVPADSFTVLDVEDGSRWSDDGPTSLHDIDGNKVHWNGSIGGAGVGDQWVEAVFDPITPAGATCTGIVVAQSIVTGATTGKTELCLADGTVINTNTSGAGNASTFSGTNIANIIANGALVRRYGTVASLFASAAFELDRVELVLFFDDVAITARPLRLVSSGGATEVTLPMIPAS